MSMQVNKPFIIELIFRDTNEVLKLMSFDPEKTNFLKTKWYSVMLYKYGKPTGFKFIELNVSTNSTKLINWLQYEFKPRFDYDPLIWIASVATLPVELRQYLIPFHKDTHDTAIS